MNLLRISTFFVGVLLCSAHGVTMTVEEKPDISEESSDDARLYAGKSASASLHLWSKSMLNNVKEKILARVDLMPTHEPSDFLATLLAYIAIEEGVFLDGYAETALENWPEAYRATNFAAKYKISDATSNACREKIAKMLMPVDKRLVDDFEVIEKGFVHLCMLSTEEVLSARFDKAFSAAKTQLTTTATSIVPKEIFAVWNVVAMNKIGNSEEEKEECDAEFFTNSVFGFQSLIDAMMIKYFGATEDSLDDLKYKYDDTPEDID